MLKVINMAALSAKVPFFSSEQVMMFYLSSKFFPTFALHSSGVAIQDDFNNFKAT